MWTGITSTINTVGWLTSRRSQVFIGRVAEIAQIRQRALQRAYEAHPERFINGAPKIALPPTEVWINPVQPDETPESIMVNFPTLPAARKTAL